MRPSSFLAVLAILFSADAHAQAREWRVAHEREIVREFVELLALPNLADDVPNIARNAAAL